MNPTATNLYSNSPQILAEPSKPKIPLPQGIPPNNEFAFNTVWKDKTVRALNEYLP